MTGKREEIVRLCTELAKLRAVRDLLGAQVVDPKIADLETLLRPLVETEGGALIAGDVDTQGGDFTGRDKITNIYQGTYHGLAPKSNAEAMEIYRQTLMDRCGLLPLQGFSDQTSDATAGRPRLSLSGVYIRSSQCLPLFC